MGKELKNARKMRAALVAGALAGAIALTGTMAWRNMSQRTVNELLADQNPGGRVHDDFNGLKNKDVYAENFTDVDTGMPVFVRIRLLEYMEKGEDAGINRTVTQEKPDGTFETVTDPDRKVTVLGTYMKDGVKTPADINDKTTWHIHKPGESAADDPFHHYWKWDTKGQGTYMPTFNKNKDSLSVDVNGTYLGLDGIFSDEDPYSDYVAYTAGDTLTDNAYYDADDNAVDEFDPVEDPKKDPPVPPGAGGTERDEEHPDGNYTKKEETHIAKSTLNSLGVMSMADWVRAGKPICNRWIYDTDGWFYWPEPVLPQTATGLLLNGVRINKALSEKCYYVIDVVGQFASAGDWGTPEEHEKNEDGTDKLDPEGKPTVTAAATGFYLDGLTAAGKALLDNAASVNFGANGKWYLPQEQKNLYKEIKNDKGELGEFICAGEDRRIGTGDDRTDVVYVEEGVTVDEKYYGKFFLKPTDTEPYYRAVGSNGLLGTAADERLWLPVGGVFPDDLKVDVVASVVVNPPAGMTPIAPSTIEMEVGTTLPAPFTATVIQGGDVLENGPVSWSVAPFARSSLAEGTFIDPNGLLTVDEHETNRELLVTATSLIDDSQKGTYHVKLYGGLNVKLGLVGGGTTIQAGKSQQIIARLYRGNELAKEQPAEFTWCDIPEFHTLDANTLTFQVDPDRSDLATLTVGRGIPKDTQVTVWAICDGVEEPCELTLTVGEPQAVEVKLRQPGTSLAPGGTMNFSATLDPVDELEDDGINWTAGPLDEDGEIINGAGGITVEDGVLKVPEDYQVSLGTEIYVKAEAAAATANGANAVSRPVKIAAPATVEIGVEGDGEFKMKLNSTLNLTATVKDADGKPYKNQDVTWSMAATDGTSDISDVTLVDGVLTTGLSQDSVSITVTARAKNDLDNCVATQEVLVDDGCITIDGYRWMVLKQVEPGEGEPDPKTLIMSKEPIGSYMQFDPVRSYWPTAYIRTTVLQSWLDGGTVPNLASMAINTTIKTRSTGDADNWDETQDKVFFLSEADIFGSYNGGVGKPAVDNDYTAGGVLTDPTGRGWLTATITAGKGFWLRTPTSNSDNRYIGNVEESNNSDSQLKVSVVSRDKSQNFGYCRPVLWVQTSAIADQLG